MKYLTNSEVLREILTKIGERSDEIRCFCPHCGQMTLMTKDTDEDGIEFWKCRNCPYECDRFDHLEEYNMMRFAQ